MRRYHHGHLRHAAIEAGMQLIEASNSADISLREIARAIGVSAPSIYRHFPDKACLLAALAVEGMDQLATAQLIASAKAGHGREGFAASGRAYVRFALAHPLLFRMIIAYLPSVDYFASAKSDTPSPVRFLREIVEALAPVGTSATEVRTAALAAWSQVHGLAMLMLEGQIPRDDALIDAMIDGKDMWPESEIHQQDYA
jgi:AcrR family transcriptional regulator